MSKNFITNDLGTAAFLMIRGCKLLNAYVDQRKVYVFEFGGDKEENRRLAIDYLNSECSKFDAQLKNLKKILKTSYI
jgi:hypothetical protein